MQVQGGLRLAKITQQGRGEAAGLVKRENLCAKKAVVSSGGLWGRQELLD